ncbi:MAG: lysophospholipid acyltransferase family protein [Saccharospirillum sp.]
MKPIIRTVRLIALIGLLLFGFALIVFHQLASLLSRNSRKDVHQVARIWYRSLLAVMNVKVTTRLATVEHRGLIVANHLSWLDIPVLGSVLPTYFLSKAEVRRYPLIGWLANQAGTLFIERGTHQLEVVRDLMQTRLTEGHFLTFFPEGTTGDGLTLKPFHPRLFAAAIETGMPVFPVALDYRTDRTQPQQPIAFGKESFAANVWRVLGQWRTQVHITAFPPLESAGMPRRALAEQSRQIIAEGLGLETDGQPST